MSETPTEPEPKPEAPKPKPPKFDPVADADSDFAIPVYPPAQGDGS